MLTSSCKAKGRRLCSELKELILRRIPSLTTNDISVTSSGAPGEDLKFSQAAIDAFPIVVECKNVESLNVWKAYAQAQDHAAKCPGRLPVLFFRRNKSEMMCALKAEDLMALIFTHGVLLGENAKGKKFETGVGCHGS